MRVTAATATKGASRLATRLRARIGAKRDMRREAKWGQPVDLGDLRRTTPITTWGASRGGSILRFYVERFIEQHASDIHGRVLEIAGDEYVQKFGRHVRQTDILDVFPDNPRATIIGDLSELPNVPDETFDCVLVTQVLSWIYDVRAALRTVERILVPGGVMLATTPGIARIAPVEAKLFGEWWHFTSLSAQRVSEEVFGEGSVEVQAQGNVLAAAGFLFGLGRYDLSAKELVVRDPAFEVVVCIRAVKTRGVALPEPAQHR